jgi:hypothetical protein
LPVFLVCLEQGRRKKLVEIKAGAKTSKFKGYGSRAVKNAVAPGSKESEQREAKLDEWEGRDRSLQLGNKQRHARFEQMGSANAVGLQDFFHRRAVALGNLQDRFAALYTMANELKLLFSLTLRLTLGDFDEWFDLAPGR